MTVMELLGTSPQMRTAYMLLTAYDRIEQQPVRSKARAVATAEYQGMCKAIDRLGFASTPTAVEMAVLDSVREAPDKPQHSFASSNTDYNQWQADVCRRIADRLGWENNS